jgi:hypothetical protein
LGQNLARYNHLSGMKTATQEGPATVPASDLVHISGKTFTGAGTPFGIRGVRYGTFLPRADGQPFPSASDVQRDFAAIRERGLNCRADLSRPAT